MELKQLEDRKHLTISFLPKKTPIFLEGVLKRFQVIKKILKRHFYFYK